MILPGSASQGLASALAARTDHDLAAVDYHRFPDGELRLAVPTPIEHAVVVTSTISARSHLEVLQLQDAAREAGVEEITTVLPYMGYARQERAFEPGEPVSARAVAKAISTGTDRVLTVNPHEPGVCDFFEVPAMAIDGAGRLAAALPADLQNPLFLSPDEGGVAVAEAVQDAYGSGAVDNFVKRRLSGETVEIEPGNADVAGRDVVVTDDIIATGSTMAEAVDVLQEREAAEVSIACVHALLAGNARSKLERAGIDRLVATDTIERAVTTVSVAPAIAARL